MPPEIAMPCSSALGLDEDAETDLPSFPLRFFSELAFFFPVSSVLIKSSLRSFVTC